MKGTGVSVKRGLCGGDPYWTGFHGGHWGDPVRDFEGDTGGH